MSPRAWHVAVVVENLPLGVDTRLRKQVEDLLAEGFRVTVVTMRHDDNEPYRHRSGLTLAEHPPPPEGRGTLGYLREYGVAFVRGSALLLRLRLRGRIDVLQLCQPPDIYFPVAWVLRSLGARVVVDQRDLMPETLASRTEEPSRLLMAVLHLLERETHRVAHHTVTVNDHLRDRLGGQDADGSVSVVRNGPVLRRVDAVVAGTRPEPRDGSFQVVWAGKIGPQDRVDLVVRLAEEIVHGRGRQDCRSSCSGTASASAELRELTVSLGLEPWVHFTGWLGEADLFARLCAADLGVDTSLQQEVSPVKAMEYFACGLPLACFDLPETRRLATGAAVLVPGGDVAALATAVLGLLDDPARREELGKRDVE